MIDRSKTTRLRVEPLEDRSMPAGSVIPAGEFNWMQYSPTGTLGQLVWSGQALVYRTRVNNGWKAETVVTSDDFTKIQYNSRDEVQEASQTAQLVYTSNGTAHAFYLEKLYNWRAKAYLTQIRHFTRTATGWKLTETVTPSWRTTWGPTNLLAKAGPGNALHLVFAETTVAATGVGNFGAGRLWHATNKTGAWKFAKIADTADLTYDVWIMGTRWAPRFMSLAVDARGAAHVTYTPRFTMTGAFGMVKSDLKYATNASGAWVSETAVAARDGTADAGLAASLAIAPNGMVAIASYYADRFETGSPKESWLMYSTRATTGGWTSTTAVSTADGYLGTDSGTYTGFSPQLSFDGQSRPSIIFSDEAAQHLPVSYANELSGQIRATTLTGGTWVTTTVYRQTDPLTNQIFYPVAATYNGRTTYAGLRATSAIDANKNPVRVDFALVDVNAPTGPTVPPTVPPPPPPPPSPPPLPPPPPPPPGVLHPVLAVGTEAGPTTLVGAYYSNGSSYWWTPFGRYFNGGAAVARADVNNDGVADIIVASGAGIPGMVRVWSGATLTLIGDYKPFGTFAGGLSVAAGDVNGDGFADIAVGVKQGGLSRVAVISGRTGQILSRFVPYGPASTSGVRLGVGDVNRDGKADVVVAPGAGSGAPIQVYDGRFLAPRVAARVIGEVDAFAPQYTGAQSIAIGDVNGDGYADIVVGTENGPAQIQIFSGAFISAGQSRPPIISGKVWDADGKGIRVAFSDDVDGDNRPDLVIVTARGGKSARYLSPQMSASDWPTGAALWFDPFPDAYSGVYVG